MPDPGGEDLLTRQKEFIATFFKRGAEMAEELLKENERLAEEVQALGRRYEDRMAQMERENHNLASLYVAAYQLHVSHDLRTVLRTIAEILINFVGAKTFAVYVRDDGESLRAIAAENAVAGALPPRPARVEAQHAGALQPGAGDPATAAPLVLFPLRMGDEVAGAVAVWEFLAQKTALDDIDHELFNLLGAQAAGALEAARLAGAGGATPGLRYAALAELL